MSKSRKHRKGSKAKLAVLKSEIQAEIPYVNIKPYSHNLISLKLRVIAEEFGYDVANEIIKTTELQELGWRPEQKKTCEKIGK